MGGQDGVRADADAWRHRYRCCNATVDRPFAHERTPHLSAARDLEKAASPVCATTNGLLQKKNVAGSMMLQEKVVVQGGKTTCNLSGTADSVLQP